MPRYTFKAYDEAGRLRPGEIDAESERAALEAIRRQGRFPLEVSADTVAASPAREPWWRQDLLGARPLPAADLAVLARELATLANADVPVDEALRIIALQPRLRRPTRQLVTAVETLVTAGASLSEALAAQGGAIPEHFWRLVRAGEVSGALPNVLAELAGFLEQSVRLRSQIVTAMLYPVVLLFTAAIALVVIVAVMVPAILPLFRDAGAEPPILIAALAGIERLIVGNWPVAVAIAVGLAGSAVWLATSEAGIAVRDTVAVRLPFIGGLVRRASTARFARTLATLIGNGVPLLNALHVTAGVVSNRKYRAAIRQAEAELNTGGTLLATLTSSGLFSALALRLIGLGEQTGQLPRMLLRVAEIYEQDLQQRLERALAVATPAVTLAIGGIVGVLMLTVISAMLGLNESVLR